MSIPMNSVCVECLFRKRLTLARELGSDQQATATAKKIMEEFVKAPPEMDSSWMGAICDKLFQENYGLNPDRLKEEKDFSNRFVLDRLEQIQSRIEKAADPVYAALQFAVLGNYLDFSALQGEVSFDALETMLDGAADIALSQEIYKEFSADLAKGKRLLYITDNAGEIVFDRLLAEQLAKTYPQLSIIFCVRGSAVSNDATRADAETAGISFPVIDSGNAIGGTVLRYAGDDLRSAIAQADVVLVKGMGNTESMYGCGYNVYYAFLVKCERFIQFFNKPKLTPMFLRDPKKRRVAADNACQDG